MSHTIFTAFDQFNAQFLIYLSQMDIIKSLLKQTSAQEQETYESSLQLHLKTLMTMLNKKSLQNTSQLELKSHRCFKQCYEDTLNKQSIDLQSLKQCKQNCRKPIEAVKQYLDDINFYSEKKFNGCSSKCYQKKSKIQQNTCLWECLNRLDRRYKKYWQQNRDKVEQKYKSV